MLHISPCTVDKLVSNVGQSNNEIVDGGDHMLKQESVGSCSVEQKLKHRILLDELEPLTLRTLHELISLVHDRVNFSLHNLPIKSTLENNRAFGEEEGNSIAKPHLFNLKYDPVAAILWDLQPLSLQRVFLAMAHSFPRTLEALILHLLSPVGAEVLTRKFDEMDHLITEDDRSEFYRIFYGVFDNQAAAMDVLLNGKESFALQAFNNVLHQFLGVNFDEPKMHGGREMRTF